MWDKLFQNLERSTFLSWVVGGGELESGKGDFNNRKETPRIVKTLYCLTLGRKQILISLYLLISISNAITRMIVPIFGLEKDSD